MSGLHKYTVNQWQAAVHYFGLSIKETVHPQVQLSHDLLTLNEPFFFFKSHKIEVI